MNNKTKAMLLIIIGCIVLCHPLCENNTPLAQEIDDIVAAATITAPSTLTALAKTSTQIFLGWNDKSTNETGFKVEKKEGGCSSTNSWTQIATKDSNVTTHTVSGLTPNTTYAFRVRAYDDSSDSTYSNCASAKTSKSGTPPAPTNLKATSVSSTKVNLTWKDNSINETGFKIYRKAGSTDWTLRATTVANVKNFSDTTATDNNSTTTYKYYIVAYNASGPSPSTNRVTVSYQPTNLIATQDTTAGTIKLTWTDKNTNETGFEIWRKTGDCSSTSAWSRVKILGANKTFWTDTAPGDYAYRVRAYKKTGVVLPAYGYSGYSYCAESGVHTNVFYVTDRDGCFGVNESGQKTLFVENISSWPGVEVYNNNIYLYNDKISIYSQLGIELDSILIPRQLGFGPFVILPQDRLASLDNTSDEIYIINYNGELLHTSKMLPQADNSLQSLDGVLVDNKLIISEDGNGHLLELDVSTYQINIFKDLSNQIPGHLGSIDYCDGVFYLASDSKVYEFTESSEPALITDLPESNITGIVILNGYAYVTVNFANRIYKINLSNGSYAVFTDNLNYPQDIELAVQKQ